MPSKCEEAAERRCRWLKETQELTAYYILFEAQPKGVHPSLLTWSHLSINSEVMASAFERELQRWIEHRMVTEQSNQKFQNFGQQRHSVAFGPSLHS